MAIISFHFVFFLFIIVITLLFSLVYTLYNPIHYKRVLSRSCKSGSWQWKCPRHTIVCYYCIDVNLPPSKLNSQIYLRSIVGHDVIRIEFVLFSLTLLLSPLHVVVIVKILYNYEKLMLPVNSVLKMVWKII